MAFDRNDSQVDPDVEVQPTYTRLELTYTPPQFEMIDLSAIRLSVLPLLSTEAMNAQSDEIRRLVMRESLERDYVRTILDGVLGSLPNPLPRFFNSRDFAYRNEPTAAPREYHYRDIAQEIANDLARRAFENLSLTENDVIAVLTRYYPTQEEQNTLTEAFIDTVLDKIIDDNHRLSLRSLLTENYNIIARVVDALQRTGRIEQNMS